MPKNNKSFIIFVWGADDNCGLFDQFVGMPDGCLQAGNQEKNDIINTELS